MEGEFAAAAAGGDGLVGGASNGSGVGVGPFFEWGLSNTIVGGGMNFGRGVDGSLMVLDKLGDEGVD